MSISKRFLIQNWHRLLWWLGLWVLIVGSGSQTADAQTTATVSVLPGEQSLEKGETISLAVTIDDATNLYGVEVHMAFDPAIVQVMDANNEKPGIQLIPGDVLDVSKGFLVANQADNDAGELVFALTLLSPAQPVFEDGKLVEFEVQAVAGGSTDFTFLTVLLASSEGESLLVNTKAGIVTVSGQPPEPSPTGSPTEFATETPPAQPTTLTAARSFSSDGSSPTMNEEQPTAGTPTIRTAAVTATASSPALADQALDNPPRTAEVDEHGGSMAPSSEDIGNPETIDAAKESNSDVESETSVSDSTVAIGGSMNEKVSIVSTSEDQAVLEGLDVPLALMFAVAVLVFIVALIALRQVLRAKK